MTETLLFLGISIALLTFKPGPGMLAIISRALNDGFLPAFFIALGIVTVQNLFFTATALGVSVTASSLSFLTDIMKVIGAVYLFYMGYKGLSNPYKGLWTKGRASEVRKQKQLLENYMAGLAITLSNPFVILFYIGIVPTILDNNTPNTANILLGCLVISSVNLTLLALEAALATQLRQTLQNNVIVKRINIFTSSAFIAIGIFLLASVWTQEAITYTL